MVTRVLTNAVSKANKEAKITTKITPEMSFANVLKSASAARSAALTFCYSVTVYMLNVCHLTDTDDKNYLSQAKAQEYIKDQLAKQTSVKGGMLDHYVRTGAELYGKLIGAGGKPTSQGAPIVALMTKADNTQDGINSVVDAIDHMLEKSAGVQSFRDLSKALGFKSFVTKPNTGTNTPAKALERAVTALTTIEKARVEGKAATPSETKVVAAVANVVSDQLALAKSAVDRWSKLDNANPDDLSELIEFCNKVLDVVLAKAEKRPRASKKAVAAKGARKAKTPTAHV